MANNFDSNPYLTTSPRSSFRKDTQGYYQGAFLDDTSSRQWLASGQLSSTVTGVVWGGIALTENIPAIDNNQPGTILTVATTNAGITAFSTFNQAYNMVISSGNPVPMASAGMNMNYFALKTNARIGVKCNATLANALDNGPVNQQVSWDLVNQELVPYSAGYASNAVTGAVWANTNGGQTTFTVTTNPTSALSAGDTVTTSGIVNTGGSSTSAFNGVFTVVSTTSTTVVVSQPASVSPGTFASNGLIQGNQGGALACTVTNFSSNSKIVSYDSSTGLYSWATGPVAIIKI